MWNVYLGKPATYLSRPVSDDLLRGARAIAIYLFGDPALTRAVYYHIEKGHLPVIRLGRAILARKSSLDLWADGQEHAARLGGDP